MTYVTDFLLSVSILDTGAVIRRSTFATAADASRLAALIFGAAGLVLALVGSFLPWVVSGQVRRSSYAITGMIDRLGVAGDGLLGTLVSGWPLIGLLCAAPVVAALLRRWVIAGVLAVVLGFADDRRGGRVAGRQRQRRYRRTGGPDRAIGDARGCDVAHRGRRLA